jgi:nucleoside-diphosphate-sugar epimerase
LAGGDLSMTAGEQVRDFTPVEQVAARLLSACRWDIDQGNPLVENVGTGHPQSIREFAEHWWTRWNAPGRLLFGALPYRRGEVMRYVPLVDSRSGSARPFAATIAPHTSESVERT